MIVKNKTLICALYLLTNSQYAMYRVNSENTGGIF